MAHSGNVRDTSRKSPDSAACTSGCSRPPTYAHGMQDDAKHQQAEKPILSLLPRSAWESPGILSFYPPLRVRNYTQTSHIRLAGHPRVQAASPRKLQPMPRSMDAPHHVEQPPMHFRNEVRRKLLPPCVWKPRATTRTHTVEVVNVVTPPEVPRNPLPRKLPTLYPLTMGHVERQRVPASPLTDRIESFVCTNHPFPFPNREDDFEKPQTTAIQLPKSHPTNSAVRIDDLSSKIEEFVKVERQLNRTINTHQARQAYLFQRARIMIFNEWEKKHIERRRRKQLLAL